MFLATLVRSAFGFGESLIAVPLLAFRIPLEVAAPLSVLISITVASIVVVQDWKKIHVGSASWLILSTLAGIPLGLLMLTSGNDLIVKAGLGVIIIAFSIYSLTGRKAVAVKAGGWSWLLGCGFCAGILGGAYGLNGPPLVIYGAMRRWTAQHFRATLQGYFLPASIVGMVGYWLAGLWVPAVTYYYLISLPLALPAIFLGRILNHRLHGESFYKYIYMGLLAIGISFLFQAISS
ncbi:sulfite exporter TauE/SafE family protein [Pontibacter rufus]|uniref:sulfite exporter TauE/SafE family protein n=1 Tax=Pontibacter rufus TaxID=2791028 RepID=UPI00351C0E49